MLAASATIAVVAPAGIPKLDGLDQGMALLRTWGYRVVEGRHVRDRQLFNAGTAAARTADLAWALSDPAVDGVWLARGGYGCIHCLPGLGDHHLSDRPVIGCSDATSLFCALLAHGHRRLVHGPMLETLAAGVDDSTRARVHALLSGHPVEPIRGKHLCGPTADVAGPVVGGNLCVLASVAGTPWASRGQGAIMVLEEIGEAAYRVDRLINQLRWSGAFDGVLGIALGDFVSCNVPQDASFSLIDVIVEALEPLGVPVVAGLPIGHGRTNLAWRYGCQGRLADGVLWFEPAADSASRA